MFFFQFVLAICSFFHFDENFRINFSTYIKKSTEICIVFMDQFGENLYSYNNEVYNSWPWYTPTSVYIHSDVSRLWFVLSYCFWDLFLVKLFLRCYYNFFLIFMFQFSFWKIKWSWFCTLSLYLEILFNLLLNSNGLSVDCFCLVLFCHFLRVLPSHLKIMTVLYLTFYFFGFYF